MTPEEESGLRRREFVIRLRHRIETKLLPMLAFALALALVAVWMGHRF